MAVLSELADVSIVRRQNVGSCLQISLLKALPEVAVNLLIFVSILLTYTNIQEPLHYL